MTSREFYLNLKTVKEFGGKIHEFPLSVKMYVN